VPKAITGFPTYWIKDPAVSETITVFHDWTTDTYGNIVRTPTAFSTGNDLCGTKAYRLYKYYNSADPVSAIPHDPAT